MTTHPTAEEFQRHHLQAGEKLEVKTDVDCDVVLFRPTAEGQSPTHPIQPMVQVSPTPDWEKELFDSIHRADCDAPGVPPHYCSCQRQDIRTTIAEAVEKERERVREAVEGMKDVWAEETEISWNSALNRVLSLLTPSKNEGN